MLPAWMIDRIKQEKERQDRHVGGEQLDLPALEEGGILQEDDTRGGLSFHTRSARV
jgi:hypothetical protein